MGKRLNGITKGFAVSVVEGSVVLQDSGQVLWSTGNDHGHWTVTALLASTSNPSAYVDWTLSRNGVIVDSGIVAVPTDELPDRMELTRALVKRGRSPRELDQEAA